MELSTADMATARPHPSGERHPTSAKAVWWRSFGVLLLVLVVRNRYLFVTKIYEAEDFGANSIAILDAKHLALLTGNYSRLGFFHPGPAFLYVEAAGELLFHDLLHVVPTPWNGQLLAIFILNAALIATAMVVMHRHHRSGIGSIACLAVVLLFAAAHPLTVGSSWMPYVYFAPTLLLMVSAASVAAGRAADLPLLALSASLCVHGHVEFLLFAPVVVLAALVTLTVRRRRAGTALLGGDRRHWFWALGVAGVFAAPIALHTALHWPGEFAKYFSYQGSGSRHRVHSAASTAGYVLHYWSSGTVAAVLLVLAYLLAKTCPRPDLRRFLLSALAMALLMSGLFVYYAMTGIDQLDQTYVGYFYWSVPLLVLMIISVGATVRLAERGAAQWAAVAAVTAFAVLATVVGQHRDNPYDPPPRYRGVPAIPGAVSILAGKSSGRPMIIGMDHDAWPDAVGLILYASRHGLRMCLRDPRWRILARPQSVCSLSEIRTGVPYHLYATVRHRAPNIPILARLHQSVVAASANG